jgi:hypothetical protein
LAAGLARAKVWSQERIESIHKMWIDVTCEIFNKRVRKIVEIF